MLGVRVIPVLSLMDQGLVKTTRFKKPHYIGDPVNAVRLFNEKQVDELVFLDIRATREGRGPDFTMIKNIASECFMPFAYGGGITTIDHVKQVFALGAEKVIFNSAIITHPETIESTSRFYGEQATVISIDAIKNWQGRYEVRTASASKKTKMSVQDAMLKAVNLGAGEIILNAVHCDGKRNGYDLALYEEIAGIVDIPVVALGGADDMDDMKRVLETGGVSDVAAGSFFTLQKEHKAVLITYPKRGDIIALQR